MVTRAHQLKVHRLAYFKETVEQGSLAAAARNLNVAQPALSQQIRELEDSIGVSLLERGYGGVRPTEAGQIFYDHAVAVLRQLDAAFEETRSLGRVVSGNVTVLVSATTSQIFLPWLIDEACDAYPNVQLHIDQSSGDEDFVAALKSGRVDFALLPEIRNVSEIETIFLTKEPLIALGLAEPIKALENLDGTIDFDRVAELPMVIPRKKHPFRARIETYADEAGKTLDVRAEASDVSILTKYVETGRFFSILPEKAVASELASGRLRAPQIVKPRLHGHYNLYRFARRTPGRAAAAIMDLLEKQWRRN